MGVAASLSTGTPRRIATPRQSADARHLQQRVRMWMNTGELDRINASLLEIQECLQLGADRDACAELAVFSGIAQSTAGFHASSIRFLTHAYKLQVAGCSVHMHNSRASRGPLKGLAVVDTLLGLEHHIVKQYAMAVKFFTRSVEYHTSRESLPQDLIPVLIDLANALHFEGQNQQAIALLDNVLVRIQDARHNVSEAGGANMAAINVGFRQNKICISLLYGRCYAALGQYSAALVSLSHAQLKHRQNTRPEHHAAAEINFAVVLWANERCSQQILRNMITPHKHLHFIGPPVSQSMLLQHLANLAGAACAAQNGLPGQHSASILLNASGDCVGVREPDSGAARAGIETKLEWRGGQADLLDVEPPSNVGCFAFTITTGENTMHYKCKPGYTLTNNNMRQVQTSLDTVRKLPPSSQDVQDVQEDAALFEAFLQLERRGVGCRDAAVQGVKDYLQAKVRDADKPKCEWCRQQHVSLLKCSGCRVVRFCPHTKHQKMATQPPFMHLSISHKKICALLKHSASLTDLADDNDPHYIAQVVNIYNQAVWQFLQTDIMARYVEKQHIEPLAYRHG